MQEPIIYRISSLAIVQNLSNVPTVLLIAAATTVLLATLFIKPIAYVAETFRIRFTKYFVARAHRPLTAIGFTIIEVLVVLAIAALILLIVFLAVPALQRSQRNNARRGDAARIAASAIAFVATNNGNLPGFTAGIYAAATATNNLNTIRTDVGTLGQFAFTTVVGNAANTAFPASTNNTLSATSATGALAAIPTSSNDDVYVVMNAVCGVNGAVTTVGATARSIAVQYTLETGTVGQSSPVCQNAQ